MEKNESGSQESEYIKWPSQRVSQGGLFHEPKIEYSKETADLLKLLMQESHMSMSIRKRINYHLRNGEPLPKPEPARINKDLDADANALEILRRAHNAKRKSLQKIMASGIYDVAAYKPKPDGRIPSEKAKKQLQEAMAGVRLSETTLKAKRLIMPQCNTTPEDIMNELLEQIDERAEWLSEMEELGEGYKYRNDVREQIAERIRHIHAIQKRLKMQKEKFRYVE